MFEIRGGRPGLPVTNSLYGLCATLNSDKTELGSCVKIEVDVLGSTSLIVLMVSPSLIVLMVSVDVKQY